MIIGVKNNRNNYSENQLTYVLPEDSFVSSDDIFYVNGGQCSRYWVDSDATYDNHHYAHTTTTYINFAFCKKGDRITSNDGHSNYWISSNTIIDVGVNLTIIPARK